MHTSILPFILYYLMTHLVQDIQFEKLKFISFGEMQINLQCLVQNEKYGSLVQKLLRIPRWQQQNIQLKGRHSYGTLYNCPGCILMKSALMCDLGALSAFKM